MVHRIGLLFLGLIATVAVVGLLSNLPSQVTGKYTASGGGEYYMGVQFIQLQPDEACIYAGYESIHPWHVVTDTYGALLSQCRYRGKIVTAPLIQMMVVP